MLASLTFPGPSSSRKAKQDSAVRYITTLFLAVALFSGAAVVNISAQAPPPRVAASLAGISWQLVKLQGSDGKAETPDDPTKYTIEFSVDGALAARVDCNRGTGTWTSSGPGQLQFGPLALTRDTCPSGSLHDRVAKDLGLVRSYVFKENRLLLSLDGGTYEFEAGRQKEPASTGSPVASTGPVAYVCMRGQIAQTQLSATFYDTTPPLVLIEHTGFTRPAFGVPAASGTKYEGQDIVFWEKDGEVSLSWLGLQFRCKRS
jgi:heat shock protein HslJ/membrane-bound inhibitor of C-type lysozyme